MGTNEHGIDIEDATALETANDAAERPELERARQEAAELRKKIRQRMHSEERRRQAEAVENPNAHRDEEPYVGD